MVENKLCTHIRISRKTKKKLLEEKERRGLSIDKIIDRMLKK